MRPNSPSFHTARIGHGPSQIEPQSDRQTMRGRSPITVSLASHELRRHLD